VFTADDFSIRAGHADGALMEKTVRPTVFEACQSSDSCTDLHGEAGNSSQAPNREIG
jgi:hypothetical protein